MTKSKDSDHCRTKPFNFVHTLVINFTTVECDTLFIFSLWKFHCITFIKDEVLLTVGCPMVPPFYIDRQISVHRKFKKIDQLIFRKAKEIHFNEKCPIL
jgi:hypothetical protein